MKNTIIVLLSLAGVAAGNTVVYTWDYSSNNAVIDGDAHGSFNTVDYTPNTGNYAGTTITTLKYTSGGSTDSPNWYETNTDVFYNAINKAMAGEVTLTISGAISTGTETTGRYTTILHVGSNDKGLTLGLQGNTLTLTNANVGTPNGVAMGTIALNSDSGNTYRLIDFSVTLGKEGVVTYSIGGSETQQASSKFTTNWSTTIQDNYQYTIGSFLPGDTTNDYYVGKWWGNLAPLTVTVTEVPEPTTATLSLLALMGLAARRRRRAA